MQDLSPDLGTRSHPHRTEQAPSPERLYLVDVLRGLASLAVVIWHYQHFFMTAPGAFITDFSHEPLYGVLAAFYTDGHRAVELFYVISGFVFFHVYLDDVATRRVSATEFFVFRFSRLYPLHVATLIAVMIGQWLSWRLTGQWTVFADNDAWHFVLNLLFAPAWGLETAPSFNGPVWSVSIEVLIYALFFVFCRVISRRIDLIVPAVSAVWLLATIVVMFAPYKTTALMAVGVAYFFAGGSALLIWRELKSRHATAGCVTGLTIAALALLAYRLDLISSFMFQTLAFPSAVLGLAFLQTLRPNAGRAVRLIGDLTYASYLIHFPIQLFIILTVRALGLTVDYTTAVMLFIYLACVVGLAIPVHFGFELPAQAWLRRRMLRQPRR